MTNQTSIAARRTQLLQQLFPVGVPTLWCPALTHYDQQGALDAARIAAHLKHLSPHVKGFLIPGSTGDGWELNGHETRQLLEIALDQARELNLHLLIGALKTDAHAALRTIDETTAWLKVRSGETDAAVALAKSHVCGFTVCPPKGKDLSQAEIESGLVAILETGLPIAIYQLPQVTQNEISPELAASLAERFANFILFKDTSGTDRVMLSGKSLAGVFAVRGAEGDYARWLNRAGGPYDGFLLSAANVFARELRQIITDISAGRLDAANQLSSRLTAVIGAVFGLVSALPDGNPFANGNKAIDHFFAHGPRALDAPPPRLHAGSSLPLDVLRQTGEILVREDLLPARGYLA